MKLYNIDYTLKKLTVFFVFLATIFSSFLDYATPLSNTRLIFSLMFVFFFLLIILTEKPIQINLPRIITPLASYSIIFLFVSAFLVWNNFYSVNLYLSFYLACIVYILDIKFFKKLLLGAIFIQVFFQLYEYSTISYLYEVVVKAYGNEFDLGLESMYLLRTKGLFEGPLTASAFAIYVAYIFRHNPYIISLALLSAILSNTRTGIITITLILIAYMFFKFRINKISSALIFLIFLIGIFFIYSSVLPTILSPAAIERLQEVGEFNNESNFKRVIYWNLGWNFYLNYELQNLFFGCSQCFGMEYNNSAENDWLMFLLELGMMGFLIYALPIIYIFYYSFYKKDYYALLLISLLILNIFVYRQVSGAQTVILHWILIFSFLKQLKLINKNLLKIKW
tara:strand:- start:70 stop:1254 length:1185 start_codon:yes stop_codon:yes gene_type:complete